VFRSVIMMFLPILLFTADDPSGEGSLTVYSIELQLCVLD
jgi:hypothetical protein